jgi:hypothetical protein
MALGDLQVDASLQEALPRPAPGGACKTGTGRNACNLLSRCGRHAIPSPREVSENNSIGVLAFCYYLVVPAKSQKTADSVARKDEA